MAKTTTWGYTNSTASEVTIPIPAIGMSTNYAVLEDKADSVIYDNITAPLNLGEKVSYFYRDLPKVNSDNSVPFPGKITEGFQFIVKVDAVSETTLDNGDVIDDPQVMMLTVRGSKDGNCTAAMLEEQFKRLIAACYDFTNQEFRFGDLMRSALQVRND